MESQACLRTPPVLTTDYVPQGRIERLADVDCYVASGSSPSVGIISIYDAFGAHNPGHLGVDILASRLNALVIEPDILEGDAAQDSWFPISDETKEVATAWTNRKFNIPWDGYFDRIREVVKVASNKFDIQRWGIVGFCFGGKVSILLSGDGTPFKASVQIHPGRMDVKDAEALTIPHRLMASKEEPADAIQQYETYFAEHPEKQGESKTYDQHHGWASGRARLDDVESKQAFEQVYNETVQFFQKHL